MLELDEQTQTVGGMRLQTFKRLYAQIIAGEEPWIALGNMMHQWFGRYQQYRAELVREAIEVPESTTPDQFRWAVWCAANFEYLCNLANFACPAWAREDRYRLFESSYYA